MTILAGGIDSCCDYWDPLKRIVWDNGRYGPISPSVALLDSNSLHSFFSHPSTSTPRWRQPKSEHVVAMWTKLKASTLLLQLRQTHRLPGYDKTFLNWMLTSVILNIEHQQTMLRDSNSVVKNPLFWEYPNRTSVTKHKQAITRTFPAAGLCTKKTNRWTGLNQRDSHCISHSYFISCT